SIAARIAIIAITTNSSIKVNPSQRRLFEGVFKWFISVPYLQTCLCQKPDERALEPVTVSGGCKLHTDLESRRIQTSRNFMVNRLRAVSNDSQVGFALICFILCLATNACNRPADYQVCFCVHTRPNVLVAVPTPSERT